MLYQSLVQAAALAVDEAVLKGSGTGNEPRGILNTAGFNTVDLSSASPDNGRH